MPRGILVRKLLSISLCRILQSFKSLLFSSLLVLTGLCLGCGGEGVFFGMGLVLCRFVICADRFLMRVYVDEEIQLLIVQLGLRLCTGKEFFFFSLQLICQLR